MLCLNLLNIVTLLNLNFILGYHPTSLKMILTIFKSKLSKSNLKETGILLSQMSVRYQKQISQLIHQNFGRVSIFRLKLMTRKVLMDGLPENISDLEEPCPICILKKATKITIGPTTDVSKFVPAFILKLDFSFFNVESIRVFTSDFVDIFSATS